MLKRAAIAAIVVACATGALADAQTDCDREDGPPDQAIIACSQVIEVDSRAAWAYFKRGDAYQFKGELDRAVADFDKAIALDPKFALAYNNRGVAYQAKRDHDRAIADFDKTIAIIDPKDVVAGAAHFNRGNSYQAKGELDRAIADFDEAIAVDPKHFDAYYDRGNANRLYLGQWHIVKGNRADAETALRAAVDTCPRSSAEYRSAIAELKRLKP